jgi:hypothetical protein
MKIKVRMRVSLYRNNVSETLFSFLFSVEFA